MEQNTSRLIFTIGSVILLGLILTVLFVSSDFNVDYDAIAQARNVRQ